MSSKIVIVDYGMGNLHSVNKAIAVVGGDPVISSDAAVIAQADKLILPGVGAFAIVWLICSAAVWYRYCRNICTAADRF